MRSKTLLVVGLLACSCARRDPVDPGPRLVLPDPPREATVAEDSIEPVERTEPVDRAEPVDRVESADPVDPVDPAKLMALPERNIAEVWAKLDAVDAELYRRADPILRRAFDDGFSEPVVEPSGGGCALGYDCLRIRKARQISATRVLGGLERRVVLDRSDFPELYVLKDESVRLRGLVEYFQRRQLADSSPLATRRW